MARSTTNDEELIEKKAAEEVEVSNSNAAFDRQIAATDKYYNDQSQLVKDWEASAKESQQAATDFTVDKIQQEKAQAEKNYLKEQSGAYTDYQKQSNKYGVNAEQMAASGLTNTGYSESSQVRMYNTWQNRVAAAKTSFDNAVLNYNNTIKEAQLQNSSAMAQLALESLQKQLEISLQGFQYKNTLILNKAQAEQDIRSRYHSEYMDILGQINAENAYELEKARLEAEGVILKDDNVATNPKDADIVTKTEQAMANGESTVDLSNNEKLYMASKKCNTYTDAIKFINDNNLKTGGTKLLTEAEWKAGKKDGRLGAAVKYNSYAEYMHAYLEWRIENQ